MKLVAAPLFIRVSRLACNSELSQVPAFVIDRLRTPRTIHNRITERAAVRRADFAAVVELLIAAGMTLRARRKRARGRTKSRAFVFRMAINAPDSRGFVRLDHGCGKRFRRVTRRATLLHVSRP